MVMGLILVFAASGCGGGGGGGGGGAAPPATPVGLSFVDVATSAGLDFTVFPVSVMPPITDPVGTAMVRHMGNGAAIADIDGDGDLDLYLLEHYNRENKLYRNEWVETGTLTFTDITPPALADIGLSRVAHFCDLNGDGLIDLLLINDDEGGPTARPSRVFENTGGGTFVDRTAGSNFRPVGYLKGGAALADYDRDGLVDIFVANWGNLAPGAPAPQFPGENQLYRNLGNFTFEDVTGTVIPTLEHNSFSAIFSDFDGDARPDLLVAVDAGEDKFYRNVNGTMFEDVSLAVGIDHFGNDMGLAAADFDNDGDLDVYSTNITDPTGFYGLGSDNVLYENQFAQTGSLEFIDRAVDFGLEDTAWGWGTQFVDLDLDGDHDLVAVNGFDQWVGPTSAVYETPSIVFEAEGGAFTRAPDLLGAPRDSRGLCAFDADRDGDLDLLITNIGSNVQLLENRSGTGGSITVKLIPDHLALGSHLFATFDPDGTGPAPTKTTRHDCVAGRSYLVGTPSEVILGLGDGASADLRVVWADGSESLVNGVTAGTILEIDALNP